MKKIIIGTVIICIIQYLSFTIIDGSIALPICIVLGWIGGSVCTHLNRDLEI